MQIEKLLKVFTIVLIGVFALTIVSRDALSVMTAALPIGLLLAIIACVAMLFVKGVSREYAKNNVRYVEREDKVAIHRVVVAKARAEIDLIKWVVWFFLVISIWFIPGVLFQLIGIIVGILLAEYLIRPMLRGKIIDYNQELEEKVKAGEDPIFQEQEYNDEEKTDGVFSRIPKKVILGTGIVIVGIIILIVVLPMFSGGSSGVGGVSPLGPDLKGIRLVKTDIQATALGTRYGAIIENTNDGEFVGEIKFRQVVNGVTTIIPVSERMPAHTQKFRGFGTILSTEKTPIFTEEIISVSGEIRK